MKQDVALHALKAAKDAPGSVAKALELNDPTMQRKRGRMMLPAPQVLMPPCLHLQPLPICECIPCGNQPVLTCCCSVCNFAENRCSND